MVEAPDRLNHIQWKFLEDHYRLKANWPRVIEIKTKEIAVFYFGNLGIRSLFFFALPLIAFWKKAHFTHWKVVTLSLVGFLFASIFPLLFLQVGVVWNSIQFWYYALIFANVLLLVSFAPLLAKRHWIAQLLVISLLVAGTVPAFIRTTQHKLTSRVTLTHQQRELLGQLSERDVVLVCPEDTLLFKTTIVQALTPARALVSDPVQLELVGADTTLLKEIESLFSRKEAGSLVEFLDEHDVRKVLCSTSDLQKFITTELEVGEAAKMQAADNWQLFSR